MSTQGYVHSIETFGSVDGPGVRFVVFLSGCRMRCAYCHNPDTWQERTGDVTSVDDLLAQAERYRPYWSGGGGITVSGGEPLLQADFVLELFRACHERGINTCLDTAGQPFTREEPFFSTFNKLMKVTDLVMLDLKHIDDEAHRELTGHSNASILDAARHMSELGVPMWIRHVLVPGINDDEDQLGRLRAFIDTLGTVRRVEVLPYHTLGVHKWQTLGIPYRLEGVEPPSDESVQTAIKILGAAPRN